MVPQEFKDYFLQCSKIYQQKIVDFLLTLSTKDSILKDTTGQHPIFCPHCKNKAITANGRLRGVQRFRCKDCSKNFSEITGKFWYNLKKKEKLPRHLYCLLAGYSIRRSAKKFHIEHKQFNASKGQRVVDKVYHIQNVNSLSMRLRKFTHKFNGVASKYIQNYLNWFLVLEKGKHSTQKLTTISMLALTSNTVWFDYKNQLFNMLIRTYLKKFM